LLTESVLSMFFGRETGLRANRLSLEPQQRGHGEPVTF
jgi:hypothetical protein